jgi:acetyl esterase/lipase
MKNLIIIICCFIVDQAIAQSTIIKLWPGSVPGETLPKHPPELRDTLKRITRITNITDPDLIVYQPVTGKNLHAAVIISPGGGNKYLAIDIEGKEIAAWLSKLGYTAFILEYRVPLKQVGELQDIQRALSIIRSRSAEWKLDKNKIGVIGFSAGGNLSARAATAFKKRTYVAIDQLDSASCRPDFALLIYPGSLATGAQHTLIPELTVDRDTPPMFLFVAADDPVGMPLSMGYALKDAKVPFELHVYPEGKHGYGLRKGNPAAEAWPPLAEQWLNKYIINK